MVNCCQFDFKLHCRIIATMNLWCRQQQFSLLSLYAVATLCFLVPQLVDLIKISYERNFTMLYSYLE